MEHTIAEAGNTVVPAISGTDRYVAEDPVTLLGLVKLIEVRGWSWQSHDDEIEGILARFGWA